MRLSPEDPNLFPVRNCIGWMRLANCRNTASYCSCVGMRDLPSGPVIFA
jgi:hypothetical protein